MGEKDTCTTKHMEMHVVYYVCEFARLCRSKRERERERERERGMGHWEVTMYITLTFAQS